MYLKSYLRLVQPAGGRRRRRTAGGLMATIADLITDRADDPSTALLFEDTAWSYAELARQAAARASLLSTVPGAGRPHVGVLLDNVPEFVFWLAAAALSRSVIVGINSTSRGPELANDIRT